MKKWFFLAGVFLLIILNNDMIAQGCSQCKMMAQQGSELDEDSFGSSINTGILYLLIIPYILLFFLFRKYIFNFFRSLSKK